MLIRTGNTLTLQHFEDAIGLDKDTGKPKMMKQRMERKCVQFIKFDDSKGGNDDVRIVWEETLLPYGIEPEDIEDLKKSWGYKTFESDVTFDDEPAGKILYCELATRDGWGEDGSTLYLNEGFGEQIFYREEHPDFPTMEELMDSKVYTDEIVARIVNEWMEKIIGTPEEIIAKNRREMRAYLGHPNIKSLTPSPPKKSKRTSEMPTQTADPHRTCFDKPNILQGQYGICWFTALLHVMFFSHGMRRFLCPYIIKMQRWQKEYLEQPQNADMANTDLAVLKRFLRYFWMYDDASILPGQPPETCSLLFKDAKYLCDRTGNNCTDAFAKRFPTKNFGSPKSSSSSLKVAINPWTTTMHERSLTKQPVTSPKSWGAVMPSTSLPFLFAMFGVSSEIMYIHADVIVPDMADRLGKWISAYCAETSQDPLVLAVTVLGRGSQTKNNVSGGRMPIAISPAGGAGFVLDACVVTLFDNEGGHAVGGVTCGDGQRIVFNSWNSIKVIEKDWLYEDIDMHGLNSGHKHSTNWTYMYVRRDVSTSTPCAYDPAGMPRTSSGNFIQRPKSANSRRRLV